MRWMAVVVMIAMLLSHGVALAGSSTDAALGLGAFAVFNQIISGTGIFGHSERAVVASHTHIARQVLVAPPPPRRLAPPPRVVPQTPTPVHYTSPPVHYHPHALHAPPQHHGS